MIDLQKIPNKDIYAFTVDQTMNQHDVQEFYELLEQQAAGPKKLRILSEIKDFPKLKDFTDFSELAQMKRKALETVGKYAVISDKSWMETLLPVGNLFTPGLPVKHFEPQERAQAIAWLESDEKDTKLMGSGLNLKIVPGTQNVYSFTIDGTITDTELTRMYQTFGEKAKNGPLNLLAVVKDFDGFDNFGTLLHGIRSDLALLGDVRKMALVSDEKWVAPLIKLADALTPNLEAKAYSLSDREKALNWLKA